MEIYQHMTEQVPISQLSKHVSNRLMNKFHALGLITVDEISHLKIENFCKIKSVGQKTIEEFIELQKKLKDDPQSLINITADKCFLAFEMNSEIKSININYLKDSISNKLRNIFDKMHLKTISDVIKITPEYLSIQASVGKNTVEEFCSLLNMVFNTPELLITESLKYSPQVLPKNIEEDFFENIENLVLEYFDILHNSKAQDVLTKRYGLLGNKQYTLEEIGLFYEVTRERIRQIEEKQVVTIYHLLSGAILKKPFICANEKIVTMFNELREIFQDQYLISEIDAFERMKETLVVKNDSSRSIMFFVFELLGFRSSRYDDVGFFYKTSTIDIIKFHTICNSIIAILQQSVKPITLFDLVIKLKKSKITPSKEIIDHAISLLPYIEVVNIGSEKSFQISFSKLTSLKDMAYRILSERKEELHSNDIFREIQHRLVLNGQNPRESVRSLNGQMVPDDRFKPIGRTGKWILTEWNHNTQSIIELVLDAFHHNNIPCSIKNIVDHILSVRPDIRASSVASILLQHKDKFLKVNRGYYILKEWRNSHPEAKDIGEETDIVDAEQLYKHLHEIFSSSSNAKLLLKEIQQQLAMYHIFWSENYCHVRLNKCPYLKKVKNGIKNYYFFNKEFKMPDQVKTSTKLEILTQRIIDYISNSKNNSLPLRSIVKHFYSQGEIKANIYGVINKNQNIFTKEEFEGVVYLSLKSESEKIKGEKDNNMKHLENIQKGEGRRIEFKSSLRWDLRRNEINKDLELVVIKAITAFLNTDGGNLYVGIDDDSNIIGIDRDLTTIKKQNEDGLILHFNQLITQYLDKSVFGFIDHTIISIAEKRVFYIEVKKSSKPVYIRIGNDKIFVIRAAASVQQLDIEDAANYIAKHWYN